MSALIQDTDPGKLPPKTRAIFSEVGLAIGMGWKPSELAAKLGVAPSLLSEWLAELRTALGLLNGVFPTLSDEEYAALRESVARQGVLVAIHVDEHGIIDGHHRARACEELAEICELVDAHPTWSDIASMGRADAVEMYGRETADAVERLAGYGPLVFEALDRRWENPPIERHTGLSTEERRRLSVSLNAPRRHLERGQRRQVVEVELMLDPDRTNGEIGALAGCSHQWVAQVRQQLREDEALLSKPQVEDEVQVLEAWRPVTEICCPNCSKTLALERAGREFRLGLAP